MHFAAWRCNQAINSWWGFLVNPPAVGWPAQSTTGENGRWKKSQAAVYKSLAALCKSLAALCRSQAAVYKSQAALCKSLAALCRSQSTLCKSLAALCRSQAAVYKSQAALCRSQSALCKSLAALYRSQSALCRSQAALCKSHASVCKSLSCIQVVTMLVAWLVTSGDNHPAATWMTKQPFTATTLHTPHGEAPGTGGPAHVARPSWLTAASKYLVRQSNMNKDRKKALSCKGAKDQPWHAGIPGPCSTPLIAVVYYTVV